MKQIQILTGSECHLLLLRLRRNFETRRRERLCIRNYCMALLMLDAGLRVAEACNLPRTSLLFAGLPANAVVVTAKVAKNHVERTVPMSGRLQDALCEMNDVWWRNDPPSSGHYAFYRLFATRPLSTRQVERFIRSAALAAFGRPAHPHQLRHTFATRLMKRVNIRIVQELLGHKDLSSTQVYTHPNNQDLKAAILGMESESANNISQQT